MVWFMWAILSHVLFCLPYLIIINLFSIFVFLIFRLLFWPIFLLKFSLKILFFLSLINHSLSHHGSHALQVCLKCTYEQRKLKECLQRSIFKSLHRQDGIPARVLKICSSSLAKPLRTLFYISFKSGKFPSCWKIANVASSLKSYRPIAICSNLAKVLESILNHKLMKYLEDISLLHECQYGFRKKSLHR